VAKGLVVSQAFNTDYVLTVPIHRSPPTWQPILQGETAERARGTVERIAEDLRRFAADPRPAPPLWSRHPGRAFSLSSGWAGIALFFAELDRAQPGRGHDDVALDLLDRAIAGTGGERVLSGLYSGFPGVAWTAEYLEGRLFESEAGEDPAEEVAAVLARHLDRSPWEGDYELIQGLAGWGVYALERWPRAFAAECLERVVARLGETAEVRSGGIAWRKPPERIEPELREDFPEGNFNLGVAHGVPGVIPVLAAASAAGVEAARPLLDGAVRWLLAQRLPPGSGSVFPAQIAPTPGDEPEASRLAWCYGDLGIACALLAAARCVGDEAGWEREALEIAHAAAARSPESESCDEAGLCHGAAGIGHLFNRLHQASGAPVLAEAARAWLRSALEMRQPEGAFGGFQCWATDLQGVSGRWDEPGFLMGAAGIGLALLAATTSQEPAWDRVLLISHPHLPASAPDGVEADARAAISARS
jgi:lantibiotic modifying enzyme